MVGLCRNCKKRDICTELCKEAELYASLDYVGNREVLTDGRSFDISSGMDWGNYINFNNSGILKDIIRSMYRDGYTCTDISYHVPCSRRYIRFITQEFR